MKGLTYNCVEALLERFVRGDVCWPNFNQSSDSELEINEKDSHTNFKVKVAAFPTFKLGVMVDCKRGVASGRRSKLAQVRSANSVTGLL